MIKKYLQFAAAGIILSLCIASLAMAQADKPTNPLIPPIVYPDTQEGATAGPSKITLVKQLPTNTIAELMARIITLVLAVTGSLAFVSFTVGGIMMVTARGNDEQITKGKKILFWSVAALAIIAASYGIVVGITQLKFFQ